MRSQIWVMFHGLYWRMSCGFCDRGICFDDRAAAVLAARAHAASHHRGAITELVVIEDDGVVAEDWTLARDPELLALEPPAVFHSSPVAIVVTGRAEDPAAFRN
jgi:hypothetical protein